MLTFILMQSLDLHIKYGIGAYGYAAQLLDLLGQSYLIVTLYAHKALLHLLIVSKFFQLATAVKMQGPVLTGNLVINFGKSRIAGQKPTSGGNAVGHIAELFRPQLTVFREELFLDKL